MHRPLFACLMAGAIAPVGAEDFAAEQAEKTTEAREAEELVQQGGFKAIKLRLGRTSLKEDLAVIATVRKTVGDEVQLMCDFNQGLSFGDALMRLHALMTVL